MGDDNVLRAPSGTGSHASTKPCGLGPSGFDPSRCAADLTAAQKKALLAFCGRQNSPWGYYASELNVSGAACNKLLQKGLLIGGRIHGDRSLSYRWTDKGSAVYRVLRAAQGDPA